MELMPPVKEMERACLEGDASYNGLFFFGVRTTGVFCRPACPARKPLPENLEYFPTARAALTSGYRPCKRCRPLETDDQPPWVSGLFAEIERDPAAHISDAQLRERGIDPGTVRRHFQRACGMTFQAFTRARRLSGAFARLRDGADLDDAVFDSGYESHSGFREAFARTFGAPPGRSRERGCVQLAWLRTPLGPMVAGAVPEGICLLEFTDRRMIEAQLAAVAHRFGGPAAPGSSELLDRLRVEIDQYFSGSLRAFTLPLVYPGSAFQTRVWEQLLRIPYGETRSYQEVAEAAGDRRAVRAAGRANGLNRLAILIPCHRVINKDGGLGGYGGGLRRKQYLLNLERASLPRAR